jgi:hypothetical protein
MATPPDQPGDAFEPCSAEQLHDDRLAGADGGVACAACRLQHEPVASDDGGTRHGDVIEKTGKAVPVPDRRHQLTPGSVRHVAVVDDLEPRRIATKLDDRHPPVEQAVPRRPARDGIGPRLANRRKGVSSIAVAVHPDRAEHDAVGEEVGDRCPRSRLAVQPLAEVTGEGVIVVQVRREQLLVTAAGHRRDVGEKLVTAHLLTEERRVVACPLVLGDSRS